MNYTLYTDSIEVSPTDKAHLEKTLQSLQKHLSGTYLIEIRIRRDTHHRKGDVVTFTVEVKCGLADKPFYTERDAETLATAGDMAIEVMEHELARAHSKAKDHDRGFPED